MASLASTLKCLGLEAYYDAFVDNGFENCNTLMKITEDDLKELGVKLGHRRILQHEITTQRKYSGQASEVSEDSEPPKGNGNVSDDSLLAWARRVFADQGQTITPQLLGKISSMLTEDGIEIKYSEFICQNRLQSTPDVIKLFLMTTPQTSEGLHQDDIAERLNLEEDDVAAAGDELLGLGVIYTTTNDETWAVLETD
ncbi:uncharacterized protein BDZ99DRAFT_474246 [Mytilinidion resinicola]|uniref:SAM domain-containing protein n=1 Tax=Mytilinidion resinicola TaxID=574789 RepID=A0A6A6Z0A6_9PEZI|nr:uncharacterized protein BDZ99DRAFT_474246 [Mytilinidion resinicola]KAF2813615.1 hypothetical protein BDZ99DRAFT_474246 [Mytilinidion resinicola]